jgi:hypothetical protein
MWADPLAAIQKEDKPREKEEREVAVLSVLADRRRRGGRQEDKTASYFLLVLSFCLIWIPAWFEFNTRTSDRM